MNTRLLPPKLQIVLVLLTIAMLLFSPVVTAQASERNYFREAYPLCFDLYPDETSWANKICTEVSARRAALFGRDELKATVDSLLIAKEEEQSREAQKRAYEAEEARKQAEAAANAPKMRDHQPFIEFYPLCYEIYPNESSESHKVCLDVSAIRAHTPYLREELKREVQATLNRAKTERQRTDRASREAAKRRAERASNLSVSPLGVDLDSWSLGGFGTIFIAELTLQNNSGRRLQDFRVSCRTYGNSGTTLSQPTTILYEALAPKERRTFKVNLGFVHSQSARAGCSATLSGS